MKNKRQIHVIPDDKKYIYSVRYVLDNFVLKEVLYFTIIFEHNKISKILLTIYVQIIIGIKMLILALLINQNLTQYIFL